MRYRAHQRLFWSFLTAAIIAETAFNVLAFRQNLLNENFESEINHSHDIVNALGDLSLSIDLLKQSVHTTDKTDEPQALARLRQTYANAKMQLREEPRLGKFSYLESATQALELDRVKTNELATLTLKLREEQQSQLRQELAEYSDSKKSAKLELIFAAMLDLLSIISAGFLWRNYDRSRQANDKAMAATIANNQQTNHELVNLIKKKNQDLRTTVHDLKNPLGSIRGFSELISEEHDPDSLSEMTQAVRRLSEHSIALVNSLLEAESKQSFGESSRANVDVVAHIHDVQVALKPELTRKRQTLLFQPKINSALVVGDHRKIWDVFMNLIGNAVKFAPLGSQILVKATTTDSHIIVEVEDEGQGFTEEDKRNAFGSFQKLSATPTGGEKSSGLGLNICNQIVKDYGGSIEILDSRAGKGARLVITLPLSNRNVATRIPIDL